METGPAERKGEDSRRERQREDRNGAVVKKGKRK